MSIVLYIGYNRSMFKLYRAQTAHLAADKVISEISNEGKYIVIAPDAFTVAVEKTISAKLGKKGFFNVEVMSFARLASVFLGENIKKCLSPAGSVMLMEKVILRRKDNLLHYGKAAGRPGFAAEIYAAITAVRNSGVSPEALLEAMKGVRKEYVRRKTHDIALLYAEYLRELAVEHTDSTTRLEALVEAIRSDELSERALDGESIGDTTFCIVDHIDLNAKQLDVVAALVAKAKDVLVAVADPSGAPNARIYPPLLEKLLARAKKENALVQLLPPRDVAVPCDLPPHKRKLATELYSYSFSEGETDSIALWEAKDAEEEVTLTATEIVSLVRKGGRRYNDVAVITPSFEEYLPIVERIFKRYDIPYFADERTPLSSSPLFRHVMLAMELSYRDYDKNFVKKYVLHDLFPLSAEEKAAFCDYIDKSGADHGAFKQPFSYFADEPDFPLAEKVRAALTEETKLFANCPRHATVREYADMLLSYLSANDYDARVERYHAAVLEAGLPDKAEIVRQIPQAMVGLLDELKELRGEEDVDLFAFIAAMKAGATQVKIASLPVSLDCVYFAPVKQAMYAPIHALFVMGAQGGLFPFEQTGEGVLGSTEYAEWQMNNVTIEKTGIEELKESRFHALQLMLRGDKSYLSYLESAPCSPIVRQITAIFGVKPVKCSDVLDTYDVDVRIPTRAAAEMALIDYSRRCNEGILTVKERMFAEVIAEALNEPFPCKHIADEPAVLSSGNAPFFRGGMTSVSALESYFKCPFMHFVKYGLGAKAKEVVSFDAVDVGDILHVFLKKYLSEYKKRNFLVDAEQAKKLTNDIVDDILSEPKYEAAAKALGGRLLARVRRRCALAASIVTEHLDATAFRPALLEKRFPEYSMSETAGKESPLERPLSTIAPEGVRLTGRIDRVDALQEEDKLLAVAYDYKTGSGSITTDDLYVGKKIQLHIYMAILEASGYAPGAALYFSLPERRKADKQLLHGPKKAEVLSSLDTALSSQPSPFTGVALKEGEAKDSESLLLTEEVFRAQVEYACAVAAQAIREIKEGFIMPTPLTSGGASPCDYCEAVNVCRRKDLRARTGKKVSPQAIYDIMHGSEEAGEAPAEE